MKKHKTIDQGQQRAEALQQEATRLAEQAKDQLAEYARIFDVSKQAKNAQSAVQDGRDQLQQAAAQASDQVTTIMASALEDAAGHLRNYSGSGPAAKVAKNTARAFEHGSESLKPWGRRSMARRLTRTVRHHPLSALLIILSAFVTAYLTSRVKQTTS